MTMLITNKMQKYEKLSNPMKLFFSLPYFKLKPTLMVYIIYNITTLSISAILIESSLHLDESYSTSSSATSINGNQW